MASVTVISCPGKISTDSVVITAHAVPDETHTLLPVGAVNPFGQPLVPFARIAGFAGGTQVSRPIRAAARERDDMVDSNGGRRAIGARVAPHGRAHHESLDRERPRSVQFSSASSVDVKSVFMGISSKPITRSLSIIFFIFAVPIAAFLISFFTMLTVVSTVQFGVFIGVFSSPARLILSTLVLIFTAPRINLRTVFFRPFIVKRTFTFGISLFPGCCARLYNLFILEVVLAKIFFLVHGGLTWRV